MLVKYFWLYSTFWFCLQIEEELASLHKERTEKIKHLFERQERELEMFDLESSRLGFGSLASFDFPKEEGRWSVSGHVVPALSPVVGFTETTQTVTMLDQYLLTHIGCENFTEGRN